MKFFVFLLSIFLVHPVFAKQVPIDKASSRIEWLGQKKVPGGDHKGTVQIKKGTVNIDKKSRLIGGTIIIDMKTIEDTDLSGKWKKKLEDHLASPDFFDVANHKEASFKITKVTPDTSNKFKVTGNLTIRGKTNPESFEMMIEKKGKTLKASGTISIDRTKYGITYNSEGNLLQKAAKIAKDKVIKDQIQLTLNLTTETI